VLIRPAADDDLPRLNDIYNHYVVNTHVTFDIEPITLVQRRDWFSHYGLSGPHRVLVADDDGVIQGFATSSPFRPRAAYATSVETSVYCDPGSVGRGVGRALYTELFHTIKDEDVHRAYAGIALPNEASIALHARFGFELIGTYTEVGRKLGRYWDVAWYEMRF